MLGGKCCSVCDSGMAEGTVSGALRASADPERLRANWAAIEAKLAICFCIGYSEIPKSWVPESDSSASWTHLSISLKLSFTICRMGMKNEPCQPVEG